MVTLDVNINWILLYKEKPFNLIWFKLNEPNSDLYKPNNRETIAYRTKYLIDAKNVLKWLFIIENIIRNLLEWWFRFGVFLGTKGGLLFIFHYWVFMPRLNCSFCFSTCRNYPPASFNTILIIFLSNNNYLNVPVADFNRIFYREY